MKNKILIVIKDFYPSMSASGNLLKKLTDVLDKLVDVTVLTRKSDNLSDREIVNNTEIYRVNINKGILSKQFNNKNVFLKATLFCIKAINYLFKQISIKNFSKKNINIIERELLSLIDSKNIKIVMPITLEEIIATLRVYKKREIEIMPYLFEEMPVYESIKLFKIFEKIRAKRITKIRDELYRESKKILVLPVLSDYFKDIDNKVIVTEHPMVINETTGENKTEDKIIITYAGGLDLRIRNPERVLNILEVIFNKKLIDNVEFYFFSYGNCQDKLKRFENIFKDSFHSMGQVTPDIAHEKLRNSNIIITIGNQGSNLVPSKLFDCISTGKPILHFYYDINDIYIEYLKKYNLSMCIDLNQDIESSAKKIRDFIISNKNNFVNFNEIKSNYKKCTPEYVSTIIVKNLSGGV